MAFVPSLNALVWFDQRPATACVVKGFDLEANLMWVRPIDGGRPQTVEISDRWSINPPKPTFPEMWCVVTPDAVSRGYLSRQLVLANAPANSLALLHVNPDNTVDVDYPFL